MAAFTHRVSTATTTNASSYTSDGFTPAANELLVICVESSAAVSGTPTLTDSQSLGFTLAVQKATDNGNASVCIFVANALAANSSMTVTFTPNVSGTGCIIHGCGVSGMTNTGAAAIKQAGPGANGSGSTLPSDTFGASCLTGNPTVGAMVNVTSPPVTTAPTNWTAKDTTGYSSPTIGGQYVTRDSGFTGTAVAWAGTNSGRWACAIVELDASAPTASRRPRQGFVSLPGTGLL